MNAFELASEKGFSSDSLPEIQEWLRNHHKVDVMPTFSKYSRTYGYKIYYIENGKTEEMNNRYDKLTFEEALEKGIRKSIELFL